jgi:Ca2+-binding RTX toxin-like protein
MQTYKDRHKIGRLVMGLLSCAAVATVAGNAWAYDGIFFKPWSGDPPVTAYVNQDPSDGSHWINWKNNKTGACAFSFLGNGGFAGDYLLSAGYAASAKIYVVTWSGSFCGYPMVPPNYNGHIFDVSTGLGNDTLQSGQGDTMLQGGGGDDLLITSGWDAESNSGNDTIVVNGSPANGYYAGAAGNDCLAISSSATPLLMTCGDGSDKWYGPGGPGNKPADCEVFYSYCCPFLIC